MEQIGEKNAFRNAQRKVQKESPGENLSRIYLPTSGIMFVTFFFHAAWGGRHARLRCIPGGMWVLCANFHRAFRICTEVCSRSPRITPFSFRVRLLLLVRAGRYRWRGPADIGLAPLTPTPPGEATEAPPPRLRAALASSYVPGWYVCAGAESRHSALPGPALPMTRLAVAGRCRCF